MKNFRVRFGGGDAVSWMLVIIVTACLVVPATSEMMGRYDTSMVNTTVGRVCPSLDVRNDVSSFDRLRGCRVVEGFVQILLIDRATESSYENISFPELREITGYLLLYRVNGLRSIGKLFPNLAVIRGYTLFFNYAFVVFEMLHLQEIGLHSMTDILRGSVMIAKNPLLCFVDTVDWDRIATSKGEHFIKGNRQKNECPMCLNDEKKPCPMSAITKERLCWNGEYCQKTCPKECGSRSCNEYGVCCHEYCLGSCTGSGPDHCLACKDVLLNGRCVKNCPINTYRYLDRRCVQEFECRNMTVPLELSGEYRKKPYKAFQEYCLLDCPPNFMEVLEGDIYKCKPCRGPCRKECPGMKVESIANAQKLRGCTYVKGSLEIQIRGGKNIVKELEDSLSMIEEIEGYLKIVRSFPLISLNFLKNLRVIHGQTLENNKYSFQVLDNQNLVELWDWETRKVDFRIEKGRLFFHFNPKLCLEKIEKLRKIAGLSESTEMEVAPDSNGDKVACNVTRLYPNVTRYMSTAVIVSWHQFKHHDRRSLLGYVVYTIEAPYQNVTLYDGRDACGPDGWMVQDVEVPANASAPVEHIITQLKPFTQYAFYVKTYTIATERLGAQSTLQYFRTLPGTPSPPLSVTASSNSSSTIAIQWVPPLRPNGNITHYIISGYWKKDDPEYLKQRNYCYDPLTLTEKKPPQLEEKREIEKTNDTCSCAEKSKKKNKLEETEVQLQIDFEDTLQNLVYIRRPTSTPSPIRRKRDVIIEGRDSGSNSTANASQGPPENFLFNVSGVTEFVIHNLSHFAEYTIAIQACREVILEDKKSPCSSESIVTMRTKQLAKADDIDSKRLFVEVSNQSSGVVLRWDRPSNPNGIIVTYQIEYRREDIENYKPTIECISSSLFEKENRYILKNLHPGNYSVQVRATSLAGFGAYTDKQYFFVKDMSASSGIQILIGALCGIMFVICVVGLIIFYLRRKYPRVPNMKLIASVNPEYVSTRYVQDEWEIEREKVELLKELGQGSFGMVYEGVVHDIEGQPLIRCAIKTVNEHASDRERSEFLNEASVMKTFHTHHVVRLLGVVSTGQPVLVVMELMANGDLKRYLRSHRPDASDNNGAQPPTLKKILKMAVEIADGMAYLAAKKYVHRDLAARNCMVSEDLTVKVGDFGMTRDIYETDYYRKGTKGLLPVRWMAPESLKDGVFTSNSDVWSYGVVLWEMATLASQPYQGLSNDQVLKYVIEGGVMERPENCPDRLYDLMRQCWQHKPIDRPSFLDIVASLLHDVPSDFEVVSFYHSREGRELRAQLAAALDDPSTPLRITRDVEDFSLGDSDVEDGRLCTTGICDDESEYVPQSYRPPPRRSVSVEVKIGNGSTVTTPTGTANGWIGSCQSNGIGTTEC